ncbi:hypothetical protein JAAARDRAFT_55779 [Jaapia argillacea MUCL 33604]|uniref:Aminotransferase class I/classII large domain-containing protein n=1 Tax=Jaapia argillacea MUCL 33604 TaxID=933084 RepID=A0A067Q275_9AGAM|nr:hypothetical protein JAAARDRAFT_55779 [Jaapia argillacea MUCL 33604]
MGDATSFTGAPGTELAHHLSCETQARLPNPMKSIWKLSLGRPECINMGNGDPHHTLYPVSEISFKVPAVTNNDPVQAWRNGTGETQVLHAYKDEPSVISLRSALRYGAGAGLLEVRQALEKVNRLLHSTTSNTHTITLSLGNADAVTKCYRLLGNPGDSFLVEEFSFPGMTNAPLAQNIKWVPVKLDEKGIIPEEMERILTDWNEAAQGRRPHVLYTIPCGQNPTGSTLSLDRRQRIYELARKWDIIIIEDDPYFFLQYDIGALDTEAVQRDGFAASFARKLAPSFLSMDVDGRVLRIDSLSKILAPGMRLGWITCNPFFAEKLEMLTDSSTQHPHGLGQVFVAEMLAETGWGMDGFIRWVKSLCDEYQRRRDFFIDTFRREIGDCGFASAEVPEAGMFIWVRVHLECHTRYQSGDDDNTIVLMQELFQNLFEAGLVLMPATTFAIVGSGAKSTPHIHTRCHFFRATFCGTEETMEAGIGIFGKTIKKFFAS